MEISISSPVLVFRSSKNLVNTPIRVNPNPNLIRRNENNLLIGTRKVSTRISAIDEVAYVANPVQVEVTWQIVVGALAGVSPFVVAGIEFSKRIIAQRRCEICGGSGLVLRDKTYFRCPGCGGFLPWQSWKRFFSGEDNKLPPTPFPKAYSVERDLLIDAD